MSGGLLKVVDEMVFGIEFWIPFFEESGQFLVGDLGPHMDQQMSSPVCSLHLLLLAEPFSEKGIHQGFDESRIAFRPLIAGERMSSRGAHRGDGWILWSIINLCGITKQVATPGKAGKQMDVATLLEQVHMRWVHVGLLCHFLYRHPLSLPDLSSHFSSVWGFTCQSCPGFFTIPDGKACAQREHHRIRGDDKETDLEQNRFHQ